MSKAITLQKLKLMFHEYYSEDALSVDTPDRIHMREFALETWEKSWFCPTRRSKGGNVTVQGCGASGTTFSWISTCPRCGSEGVQLNTWNRHLSYGSQDELRKALMTKAPHSVYHSAAFYTLPVARMSAKDWQGAELVFDIDADHLDLPCSMDHDIWQCKNDECGESGSGPAPEKCPSCGNTGFNTRKWLCEKCLGEAKKHTVKLHDEFLVGDFGFSPEKIQINYSGHRGYHVRVRDPRVFTLDDSARMEIVNYIMGLGFRPEKTIVSRSGVNTIPSRDMPGWQGKIADALVEFVRSIETYSGEERWAKILKDLQSDQRKKKSWKKILQDLQRERPVLSRAAKGVGRKSWQEIATKAVELYGGEIDKPVTHDIHRVIRLIGSLSGKTGFTVSELTREQLDEFDPFRDAIAFAEGTMRIVFPPRPQVPPYRIGDTEYGPFGDESVELPTAAATFALCKGVALLE